MGFNKIFLFFAVTILVLISRTDATIDLSNLDISKFKFFKYDQESRHHGGPYGQPQAAQNGGGHPLLGLLQPVTDHVQKTKAMLTYFKNVLFGNPSHKEEAVIEFDPHFGNAWQPHYEDHYGNHGEYLVEALGQGYSPDQYKNYKNGHNGYNNGHNNGYNNEYNNGFKTDHSNGYNDYNNGNQKDHSNGYNNNYNNGHQNDHSNGNTNDYNNGYKTDHSNGYNDYNNGNQNDHSNGYNNNYNNGHQNDHSNGYTDDFNNGYKNDHNNGHGNHV